MLLDLQVVCRRFDIDTKEEKLIDATVFMTELLRMGELQVKSIDQLIQGVGAKLGPNGKMRYLKLHAHGNHEAFSIGTDDITTHFPKSDVAPLARLTPYFDSSGALILYVCEIGQAKNVLITLAEVLRVPVYACEGDISPNFGVLLYGHPKAVFWGRRVAAFPDGSTKVDVQYPDYQEALEQRVPELVPLGP